MERLPSQKFKLQRLKQSYFLSPLTFRTLLVIVSDLVSEQCTI